MTIELISGPIETISGPEYLLRSDQLQACRICPHSLPEPLETLLRHLKGVHEFPVVADYLHEGVRYVELDKGGICSDRAKKILKKV